MSRYSKLIAAVIGNLVAILLVYLASKGVAQCTVLNGDEVCTMFGMSNAEITAIVMTIFNSAFVYFAPKNTP